MTEIDDVILPLGAIHYKTVRGLTLATLIQNHLNSLSKAEAENLLADEMIPVNFGV